MSTTMRAIAAGFIGLLMSSSVVIYAVLHEPPEVELIPHCDLAIGTTAGTLCFDRTDGNGKQIPFPQVEADAVQSTIKAACHVPSDAEKPRLGQ
jgi:hypothetical protein